jgi:hypothetical protein
MAGLMYEILKRMQTDLNALVFVDCYALSNTMPSVDDWVLLLEAYEAINPGDEQSAVVPGGPRKWEVTFKKLLSTDALNVALPFVTDSEPEHEACEIYQLKSEQISDGQTKIEIKSDYINGHFVCESVQVKQLSA